MFLLMGSIPNSKLATTFLGDSKSKTKFRLTVPGDNQPFNVVIGYIAFYKKAP